MNSVRQAYVNSVLRNYVRLPGTPLRASRRDRAFARLLFDRRVPLQAVYAGFVIAVARREIRSADQPSLPAIRTLHYFQGAIADVLQAGLDRNYVDYLAAKISPLVAQKDAMLRSARDDPSHFRAF